MHTLQHFACPVCLHVLDSYSFHTALRGNDLHLTAFCHNCKGIIGVLRLAPGHFAMTPYALRNHGCGTQPPNNDQAAARLSEIREIIENVDDRCLAVDGPVTPTHRAITLAEIQHIYHLAGGKPEATIDRIHRSEERL